VNKFFQDLSHVVAGHARQPWEIGFFDQQVPLGADWKGALAEALGTAEVFVPLYSPGYFSRSWPPIEEEAFRGRLASAGTADADKARHIAPVLWIPLPSWEQHAGTKDALELGEGVPEYAENGMKALCMIGSYEDQYRTVVDRLARQIVFSAERFSLGPSRAPRLDEVLGTIKAEVAFVVAVLAPTRADLPSGRTPEAYADASTRWRPFTHRQELPVAVDARSTAERLGLETRIVDFAAAGHLLGRPAVLLIDPWITASTAGELALDRAVQSLAEWVIPLVVVSDEDSQYADRGARLADGVMAMLSEAGVRRVEKVGRVKEFVDIMPSLITAARRQYLKHGPVFPPEGTASERPRLGLVEPVEVHQSRKTDDD
jgi:FxsC-like protein